MSDGPTLQHGSRGLPVRTLCAEVLRDGGASPRARASGERLSVGTARDNDLVLDDPTVSRYHAELSCVRDGVQVIDCGSTNGTRVGEVRLERGVVAPGTVLHLGRAQLRVGEGQPIEVELHHGEQWSGLRGRTPVMRRLMAQVAKAAKSDVPVLLIGESGTGKEVIARALHEGSPRARGPMVTVDCGSLTPTLVASELFGHEKGAFTGADRQHIGAFEQADGGTLFLDEIGELPAKLQPALLGVLERRRFRRLGGKREIEVDVRLVSATHRDLREQVNRGEFRLDLFYRLAVLRLTVPPLRDRRDDIPLLVEHFLREAGHDGPVEALISDAAMAQLCEHRWPGNVRELRNLVEATLAMGEPPELEDMAAPTAGAANGDADVIEPLLSRTYREARGALLHEFERRYLTRLLERAGGNVSKAAREARMDRSHLNDMLRRHQLR